MLPRISGHARHAANETNHGVAICGEVCLKAELENQ
jgi:hypothetical protein